MSSATDAPVFPEGPDADRDRVTLRVGRDALDSVDRLVEQGAFRDRSHALRTAVAEFVDERADGGEERV